MPPLHDQLATRAILGRATLEVVRRHGSLGGRTAGRNVAVLYALSILGPMPATAAKVAEAVLVTPKTAARILELLAEAELTEQVPVARDATPCWQLGPPIMAEARRLGAYLEQVLEP